MHKADKELAEVANRWEEIKKGTSQVSNGDKESKRVANIIACIVIVSKLCTSGATAAC